MNKNRITLIAIIILAVLAYLSRDLWMEYVISNQTPSCITVTTPAADANVTFPLIVSGTMEYGCRPIFEADAGHVVIQQNNQDISTLGPYNGLMTVSGDYYQQSDYPIIRSTTIQNLSGAYTGPAELVLSPSSPCGEGPDCPVLPDSMSISINLP